MNNVVVMWCGDLMVTHQVPQQWPLKVVLMTQLPFWIQHRVFYSPIRPRTKAHYNPDFCGSILEPVVLFYYEDEAFTLAWRLD